MPVKSNLITYGCPLKLRWQIDYDRWAFANRVPMGGDVPSRPTLFRKIADTLLPDHFEWHSWTDRVLGPLCDVTDNTQLKAICLRGFPGCSNSAKTRNIISYGCVWWLCDPENSSVTLVSTTVKSLRRRGWAEVQRCFDELGKWRTGNFVDSRMLWQVKPGDDKNAIIGRAVEEGSTHKVADDIKGVHTRRQMVIIDEATAVPEAIYDACANLFSYPQEFILVCIGNPRNRLDAFGRFCEPIKGWLSVTVDTGEWEAKPLLTCGGVNPMIVTMDAEKSPNIIEGRLVSKHLPTEQSVNMAKKAGGGQTPHYWQNFRGFWPPEGLVKTVFTESALVTFGGYDKHIFTGDKFQIIASFDPAYGGDRACLRFAKLGEVSIEGELTWGIEVMPPIIIPIDASSTNPAHYQLSEQVRRQCEKVLIGNHEWHCPPENLGVDDTGEGGLCDVFYKTWSNRVIRIEFGGSPSPEPCSLEDMRPANEVYRNKRAEMYFRSRDSLNSRQLKGIDVETAVELCSIEFDDVGKPKLVLMAKSDYREKFGKSPDLADTVAMLLEVARIKGFQLAPVGETARSATQISDNFANIQAVYEHGQHDPEEMPQMETVW